jgi:hypothetical protein
VSQRWLSVLVLALGCGGGGGSQPMPNDAAATPDAAVRSFMQAVADSNITRMGRYWGTGKGPAAIVGQPADHQQRLTVTQAFLRGSPYRIVRMDPAASGRMTVTVDLDRRDPGGATCVRQVPFGVVKTDKYGWIVSSIDLNQVGAPARPCTPRT